MIALQPQYHSNTLTFTIMKFRIAGFLALILAHTTSVLTAQSFSLAKMIDATRCKSDSCFGTVIKADSMYFQRSFSNATGTFFRYENCGEVKPESKLVIHYALLNDKHFNASFLTWSEAFNTNLLMEMKSLGFSKMENPDDPNKERTWYHSPVYEHMNLMWEN